MEYIWLVTLLAAVQCVVFGVLTGAARAKGGVQAPAISGNELFERRFRVHYNTLEQLVGFLPGLWAFAMFISELAAAILGVIYLIGGSGCPRQTHRSFRPIPHPKAPSRPQARASRNGGNPAGGNSKENTYVNPFRSNQEILVLASSIRRARR